MGMDIDWRHKCDCGSWILESQLSASGGVCPSCNEKVFVRLTKAEKRVLDEAREIDDWFDSREIRCQERVISQLVEKGALIQHRASGGPSEYATVDVVEREGA